MKCAVLCFGGIIMIIVGLFIEELYYAAIGLWLLWLGLGTSSI